MQHTADQLLHSDIQSGSLERVHAQRRAHFNFNSSDQGVASDEASQVADVELLVRSFAFHVVSGHFGREDETEQTMRRHLRGLQQPEHVHHNEA